MIEVVKTTEGFQDGVHAVVFPKGGCPRLAPPTYLGLNTKVQLTDGIEQQDDGSGEIVFFTTQADGRAHDVVLALRYRVNAPRTVELKDLRWVLLGETGNIHDLVTDAIFGASDSFKDVGPAVMAE